MKDIYCQDYGLRIWWLVRMLRRFGCVKAEAKDLIGQYGGCNPSSWLLIENKIQTSSKGDQDNKFPEKHGEFGWAEFEGMNKVVKSALIGVS